MLRLLQTLEPPGIGARNLRECLMIQLEYLESAGHHASPSPGRSSAPTSRSWASTSSARSPRTCRISSEVVADVWDFIKRELNPHPAQRVLSATGQRDSRDDPLLLRAARRHHLRAGRRVRGRGGGVQALPAPGVARVLPAQRRAGDGTESATPTTRSATSSSTWLGPSCSSPTSTSAGRPFTGSHHAWWSARRSSYRRACAT